MKIPFQKGLMALMDISPFLQVITWFQNRRAKMKRDIEELKKDVESVKALTGQNGFLEDITDMNLLKKKSITMHDDSLSPRN